MPIALDPKAVFRVVLESDQEKDPRPAFLYRYLSASKSRHLEEIMRLLTEEKPGTETWSRIKEVILAGLAGWENMVKETGEPIPFEPNAIFDICTDREIGELMVKVMAGRGMGADDRKKSEPPSPSEPVNSAVVAADSTKTVGDPA